MSKDKKLENSKSPFPSLLPSHLSRLMHPSLMSTPFHPMSNGSWWWSRVLSCVSSSVHPRPTPQAVAHEPGSGWCCHVSRGSVCGAWVVWWGVELAASRCHASTTPWADAHRHGGVGAVIIITGGVPLILSSLSTHNPPGKQGLVTVVVGAHYHCQ